ncbi:hypothetical protein BGX21_000500, partial [Mortierella sp. AD011]
MNNEITLFCIVDKDSNAFPIDILPKKTIGHLKELIKNKNSPRFDHIVSCELTLWRVSLSSAPERQITLDPLTADKLGNSTSKIGKVFGESPPEETIHVIVQPPPEYKVWYIVDLPDRRWCLIDLKRIRNVTELKDAIVGDCQELKLQGKSLISLKATNKNVDSSEAVSLDPRHSLREVLTSFEIMEVDDIDIEKVFSEHIWVFVSYPTELSTASRKRARESVSDESVLEQLRNLQNDNKTLRNDYKTLHHRQEELDWEFKKSKHTLTSNLDIANLVLREAEISYGFFKDRFETVSTTFLNNKSLSSAAGLQISCEKESDTQKKFNAFFLLLKASTQAPWVIHDSSVDNYLKDPTGKIDFSILDGNIVTWSQLVSAIELKFNFGDMNKKKRSGEPASDHHHDAIGQLADRFSTIFDQQEDRKEVIGAIASDSQVEFLYRDREFNYKRSGLLPLDFTDSRSVGLILLTKLVTAPKELLGYVPPINEQQLVEASIPGFKFGGILRRRPSTPGTFVAVVTTDQNEEAVIKTSLPTSVNELQILQTLASYNIEHTPRVYKSGVLYNDY